MIIGITGTYASGKGTIVEILKEKGFKHYSVRDFLVEEIKKRNLPVNRDSMIFVGNDLRTKNSPSYIAEKLYSFEKEKSENSVIESLRAPGEIEALRKKGNFYLFSIDAPQEIRYQRAIERKSESDKVTFEEFINQEKRESESQNPNEQNLFACMKLADFHFYNDGSITDLENKVKEIISNKLYNNKRQ